MDTSGRPCFDLTQMGDSDKHNLCVTFLDAVQRFFDDPVNREDFEHWQQNKKGGTFMTDFTIHLDTPELVTAINALTNVLQTFSDVSAKPDNPTTPTPVSVPAPAPAPVTATNSTPAPSAPAPAPVPVTEKEYTFDDIREMGSKLLDKCGDAAMQQLSDVLKRYGIDAITQLVPGQYAAFVGDLKKLGVE